MARPSGRWRPSYRIGPSSVTNRFEGKAAVVAGASRGIGLAIAARLVAEGAKACLTARNQEAPDEAVASLGGPDHAIAFGGKNDDMEH